MVERKIRNFEVAGSTPASGSKRINMPINEVCGILILLFLFVGLNDAPLAQLDRASGYGPEDFGGSSPSGRII